MPNTANTISAKLKGVDNMKKDIKKFEVGKSYYFVNYGDMSDTKIAFEIFARTAKFVTIYNDISKKNVRCKVSVMDDSEYILPYGNYSGAPTLRARNVMTAEEIAEIATEEKNTLNIDCNVCAVYEDDEDDELIDEAEVITVEEKVIATADLEKELTRIKGHVEVMKEIIFDNNVAIKGNQKKILEYIAAIMTNENAITAYGVENISLGNKIDELEEEAAALEAEILNRKITESYIDSIVTAAAFNASIQAEEMAAANNAEPVTFELERFNDGEIVSGVAEIETAVSEVPIVDEGAEDEYNSTLKKFNDEIANIETQIKKLQEEIIIPLQKKLEESVKQRNLHIRAMEKWVQKKIPEVTLTEYIKLTSQHGTTTATLRKEDDGTNRLFVDGDSNGGFKISGYKKTLASYSTLKAFKAAVNGLAAAIERGDKKFTFPADDSEKERKKTA